MLEFSFKRLVKVVKTFFLYDASYKVLQRLEAGPCIYCSLCHTFTDIYLLFY